MLVTRPFVLAASIITVASPGQARADEAEELAAEGLQSAQRGDLEAAAAAFEKAFAANPRPRYRCNLGTVHYSRKDYQRAHVFLRWCLDRVSTAPEGIARVSSFVERELRARGLVRIRVQTQPSGALVTLTDLPALAAPVSAFLPPGEHQVEVALEGHRSRSETVTVEPGVDRNVTVTLEPIKAPPTEPPAPEPEPEPKVESITGPIERPARRAESRWGRTWAWVAGGAAIAGLGIGVGFRLHAGQVVSDELDPPPPDGPEYRSAKNRAERSYHIGIGGFVAAGVLAATSAVLFALPERSRAIQVGAVPTTGGAFVGVVWRR